MTFGLDACLSPLQDHMSNRPGIIAPEPLSNCSHSGAGRFTTRQAAMNAVVVATHTSVLGSRFLQISGDIGTEFKGCCWTRESGLGSNLC